MNALAAALFGALLKWLGDLFMARQDKADALNTAKGEGAAEAGNETQDVIADIADQRSQLAPVPSDAGALVERMRRDAARARSGHPDSSGSH